MEILEEMKDKPILFSKRGLLLISILYTPLFGALVYVSNLQEIEKRNFIAPTIITMMIVNWVIFVQIMPKISFPPYITWPIVNGIGGSLIIGPFWDHHIKNKTEYEEKKLWVRY